MKLNRKNKLLLTGILVTVFLSYKLAIKETLTYYNQYSYQKKVLSKGENSPTVLNNLRTREKQLDQWLSNNKKINSFQNDLLKLLNTYCLVNSLKIINFKEPHITSIGESQISTYEFTLEGKFNSVLTLINNIENSPNAGNIRHITSEKKINYKTNTEYVTSTVLIQKTFIK